jgi:acetyltransferase-like isoleucine patch superfamily enzyme
MTFVASDYDGTWDLATLPDNIRIGAGCWIESRDSFARFRTTRDPGLVLGDRVRIHCFTRFSLEHAGAVQVGDDSILVGAMFMGAGDITLGRNVIVSYGVTIADCDFHPHDPDLRRLDAVAHAPYGDYDARQVLRPEPVTIGDGVRIGIGAIVLKGVTIGDGAMVGPGAVVTRDVPADGRVAGNPARLVTAEEAGW